MNLLHLWFDIRKVSNFSLCSCPTTFTNFKPGFQFDFFDVFKIQGRFVNLPTTDLTLLVLRAYEVMWCLQQTIYYILHKYVKIFQNCKYVVKQNINLKDSKICLFIIYEYVTETNVLIFSGFGNYVVVSKQLSYVHIFFLQPKKC